MFKQWKFQKIEWIVHKKALKKKGVINKSTDTRGWANASLMLTQRLIIPALDQHLALVGCII